MKDQADTWGKIREWARDIRSGNPKQARNKMQPYLDQAGRKEKVYFAIAQLLLDMGDYIAAITELDHVLMESHDKRWKNTAHIYMSYSLKSIGERYKYQGEAEVAMGYFKLGLVEVDKGLAGNAHSRAHYFGIVYKVTLHYHLGEYEEAIRTPNHQGLLPISGAPQNAQENLEKILELAMKKIDTKEVLH